MDCYVALSEMEHSIFYLKSLLSVTSDLIMSELRAYQNLLTSSKIAPLCLRQVLVVRKSKIQI